MKKPRAKVAPYKTVFKGEIFEIKQAKVTLPSGKKTVYEAMFRNPSVMILPIDKKGRLLLTREYRSRLKKYVWGVAAGKADKGENPMKAAQRELQEETGLKAKKLTLLHLSEGGQSWAWKRYAYVATNLTEDRLVGDEDEDIEVVPVSIDKAFEMIKNEEIYNENMAYMIFQLWAHRKKFGI